MMPLKRNGLKLGDLGVIFILNKPFHSSWKNGRGQGKEVVWATSKWLVYWWLLLIGYLIDTFNVKARK